MHGFPTIAAMVLGLGQLSAQYTAPNAPSRGTIAVVADDRGAPSELDPIFVDAVQRALLDDDFVMLPGSDHSRYIAKVWVTRETPRVVATPVSALPAEASGASLAIALPTHNTELRDLVVTRLRVRIVLRGNGRTIWRGSVLTDGIDGTAADDPSVVAAKLAAVLIRRFPEPADTTIAVP